MESLVSFFNAVGQVKEVHTQVDFYTYIKSVEYMICVAFFIGFPMLYRHINKDTNGHGDNHGH